MSAPTSADTLAALPARATAPGSVARATSRTADRLDLAFALGSALTGAVTVAWGIGRYPSLGGDEGIYVNQAWAVARGSLTPYTYTYDHPFLGWAQLSPLLDIAERLQVGGTLSVVNGRAVMVLYAFVTLLLTYGIARRLRIRTPYAALGVVLLGLSPLFVVQARQVYLDNIALPWILGSVWLALTPRRRLWTYAAAGLALAVGVLSKETMLAFAPVTFLLVWTRAYRPARAMCLALFTGVTGLTLLSYPLFALLRGELLPGSGHVSLWTNGIVYQLASRQGSGALWQHQSARQDLLRSWLSTDHVLLCAGFACALGCLLVERLRALALGPLLWAIPVIKPGGYLPAMYVIAVLPFCALAIAGLIDALHTGLLTRLTNRHPSHASRRFTIITAGVAATVAVSLAAATLTSYLPSDRAVTFEDRDTVTVSLLAERYLEAHASPQDNVLVDDAYWTDLVRDGFGHPWQGAISYYQFDLDPISSNQHLPQGWQDIDYVVETTAMQQNIANLGLTKLGQVFAHSQIVATWGTGTDRVSIRRVDTTTYNNHGLAPR